MGEAGDTQFRFGDQRLNSRGEKIFKRFDAQPTASVNQSCGSWSESKACYRFFDNPKVTPDKILLPHREATVRRLQGEKIVLCVQDTTILNYSHRPHKVAGLGKLRLEKEQGLFLHPTIAVSQTGVMLGILHHQTWTRPSFLEKGYHPKPIEEKESLRWLDSYRQMKALAQTSPETLFINMTDREGDFYEYFQEYEPNRCPNAHFLVRARMLRKIRTETGEVTPLFKEVQQQEPWGEIEFDLAAISTETNPTKARKARRVRQEIKVKEVLIAPPPKVKKFKGLSSLKVTAILCTEVGQDLGEDPVQWLLLTSLPLGQLPLERLLEFYRLRWQIELFFKILKSGCKIEELQLESYERITRCVALYMIVAWRVLRTKTLGAQSPSLPCSVLYEDQEWKALYCIVYKAPPPSDPPSLEEMNRLVASLGGFLNRKGDKLPGIQTLWRGLQRLRDFTLAYESFLLLPTCG
jgi:Transposase Tn5 dimerisation domain/Transposase DNA-binding